MGKGIGTLDIQAHNLVEVFIVMLICQREEEYVVSGLNLNYVSVFIQNCLQFPKCFAP